MSRRRTQTTSGLSQPSDAFFYENSGNTWFDLEDRTTYRIAGVVYTHNLQVLFREAMTALSRAGRSAQKSVFVGAGLRQVYSFHTGDNPTQAFRLP